MAREHGGYQSVHDAIIGTAIDLIVSRGVSEASLAEISTAAKLSKGTIYYYYRTKDELVNAVADLSFAHTTDAIFNWIAGLSKEKNDGAALDPLFEALTAEEDMLRLHAELLLDAMKKTSAIRERMAQKYEEWTVMLDVGILKLPIRLHKELRELAKQFFVVLDGYAAAYCMGVSADKAAVMRLLRVREDL